MGKFIDRIHLAQYRERWWNAANVVLNLLIFLKGGEFLEQLSDCLFFSNSSVASTLVVRYCVFHAVFIVQFQRTNAVTMPLFCEAVGA